MPRSLRFLATIPLVFFLYFFGLTAAGLSGPDEPRYASIAREMAHSGDWVTPRLWGEPWFEKPALLYWMEAAAFRLGLNDDLAPRLPIALASVAFLIFFYWVLRREFGDPAAAYATAILGTSVAWLAFSHVGTTDLPMSAAFAAAMLLSLGWIERGDRRWLPLAAALLGVAVLAKGLVPVVLALPLAWMGRRRLLDWFRPTVIATFAVVALPWYLLCFLRNGRRFLETFFWQQQFARFVTPERAHGQPFWYYVPVLVAALFPWIPMLIPIARRSLYSDTRRRFLLAWVLFGLLFFSASRKKLPGDSTSIPACWPCLLDRPRLREVAGPHGNRRAPHSPWPHRRHPAHRPPPPPVYPIHHSVLPVDLASPRAPGPRRLVSRSVRLPCCRHRSVSRRHHCRCSQH